MKYNILKQKQKHKKIRNIYEVQFKKIGLLFFFLQGYSEMKMNLRNNRGVLEDFKRK